MAAEYYREQGYQVINVNERGFPDLIVRKGKQIQFFVEVKAGRVPLTRYQEEAHIKWKNEGFKTEVKRVKDGKIVK